MQVFFVDEGNPSVIGENQAVKRKIERFPEDFMFQLNK